MMELRPLLQLLHPRSGARAHPGSAGGPRVLSPVPSRSCFSSDTHWVWGPRCEAAVHWRALVGCLAGVALLLLLLLLLLGVLVARARRRRSSRQDR